MALMTLCKDCGAKIPYRTTRCKECTSNREVQLKDKTKQYNSDRYIRDKANEDKIRMFYVSNEWKNKRQEIIKRDNNECQICKVLSKFVQSDDVHHIVPMTKDFSKKLDNNNLISLCSKCHKDIHYHKIDNKDKFEKYVKQKINSDRFLQSLLKNNFQK